MGLEVKALNMGPSYDHISRNHLLVSFPIYLLFLELYINKNIDTMNALHKDLNWPYFQR